MPRTGFTRPGLRLAVSVAVVAVGVAGNTVFDTPLRMIPALGLMALGVAGVTSTTRESGTAQLRHAVRRWWLFAFATFLPYALVTAPDSDSAVAVGDALAAPGVGLVLESLAGATVLCAVSMTVLYGFAWYGIHPGQPSPEERVLAGGDD